MRGHTLRVPVVLISLALVVSACASRPVTSFLDMFGLVPRLSPAFVDEVTPHGGYLAVDLRSERYAGLLWTPNTPDCRTVIGSGDLRYDRASGRGTLFGGGGRCEVQGVGSLGWLRDEQPRRALARPVPRARAGYREVARSAGLVFLRGEFRLAGLLGWSQATDTIAVVEERAECEDPLRRGTAAHEFRQSGPHPLVLVGEKGDCPILGLIEPGAPVSSEPR